MFGSLCGAGSRSRCRAGCPFGMMDRMRLGVVYQVAKLLGETTQLPSARVRPLSRRALHAEGPEGFKNYGRARGPPVLVNKTAEDVPSMDPPSIRVPSR